MRGILRGVVAVLMLAGCGGVEGDAAIQDDPNLDEQGQRIGKCSDIVGRPCGIGGSNVCYTGANSYFCECPSGYWVCS